MFELISVNFMNCREMKKKNKINVNRLERRRKSIVCDDRTRKKTRVNCGSMGNVRNSFGSVFTYEIR